VTTFRPEYRAPWAHRSHYGQLALLPLAEEAAAELLSDLLGRHPSLDGVAELVGQRTGGNPFFIQEVVHGLVEEGSLVGRRGAYELARTISEVKVPPTVQAVLAARIDRLSGSDKALLQTAAVIGRRFSAPLVGRVSGLADEELEAALRTLVDADFVYETAPYPESEYTFKHALTEEVAYHSQLGKHRAKTHAAVAQALAELDADKLDERAPLIARHYEAGGELLEAARWNARAANWAGFSHPMEATRHWRRVRTLTDRLQQSPETAELGINARLMLFSFLWRLGAASEEGRILWEDDAAAVFAEAEALVDDARQPGQKAMVVAAYGTVRLLTDAVEDGYELCARATRLADETGDRALRAVVRTAALWGLFVLGRVREAAAMAADLVAIIGEDRSVGRGTIIDSPYGYSRMHVAHLTAYFDRLDDGLVALDRAIELLGDEGGLESQSWACRNWAVLADLAGVDPEVTAAHARHALDWAEESGGAWSRIYTREGVATSHAQRGEWARAIEVVDEALAIARQRRIALVNVSLLLSIRARAQTGQRDFAGARSSAEEAIAVALRCGAQFYEAQARHQLARAILAARSPGDETVVRGELDRALSIVQALGIRAYAPHLYLERADLARALDDEVGYESELREAHRLFLDVGAHGRAEEVASLVRSS
jgi:tetratricopeptide (TPR) repeat protein